MYPNEALSIILVSAVNQISANKIVSGLIEGDEPSERNFSGEYCVWRLVNKYYRADVRLQPLADGEPPPVQLAHLIEAHIILLNTDEAVECAERRFLAAGDLSRRAHVKLLLTEGEEHPRLVEWACRRRYELVGLAQAPEDGDGYEDDIHGIARARDALHAHTWRGLTRLDKPNDAVPALEAADSDSDSCDSWGSWQGGGGGGGGALGPLLGALGERRAELGALDDAARRRRAEQLLAAFCGALAEPDPPHPPHPR